MKSAFRLVLLLLGSHLLFGMQLSAQDEGPSLEELMREADAAVAAQKSKIAETVNAALTVFRNTRSDAGEIALVRARVGELGPAAVPNLLTALESEKSGPAVREIADLIAEIDDESAVPALLRFSRGKNELRADHAMRALGRLAPPDRAAELLEITLATTSDRVRAAGVVALAQQGYEPARPLWEESITSASARVRRAAVQAFGLAGKASDVKRLEVALTDDDDKVAVATIPALGQIAERHRSNRALTIVHEAMARDDEDFVIAGLDVVEQLKNSTSKSHLKRLVDDLGGEKPARRFKDQEELRKRAAIILFQLGVSYGRDELAEPYRKAIRARPRRARAEWQSLSKLYFEFGDWKSTIDAAEKALKKLENSGQRFEIMLRIARSQAQLGKFGKAQKTLREAQGAPPWPDLANDPYFEEMRQDRRYRKDFIR